jgi:hypothetical protein
MNRRRFLKYVVATAAVGAVAPTVLAEPVAMGVDVALGADSVLYTLTFDGEDLNWIETTVHRELDWDWVEMTVTTANFFLTTKQ